MKRKYKVIGMLFLLNLLSIAAGATYSYFKGGAFLNSDDISLAKFVFEANTLEEFELPLNNIKPGDDNDYFLSVKNNENNVLSEIDVEYKITIKTYHFIPLEILLYNVNDTEELLILDCNEDDFDRNDKNELVCITDEILLPYKTMKEDQYKLNINFKEEFNELMYQDLVDFIQLRIDSWQKKEE